MAEPSWAERHARTYQTPLGRRMLEIETELLLEVLPASGRVLSVGCGLALHEAGVMRARPDLEVIGLDVDPEMLAKADPEVDAILGDAGALPLPPEVLDAVFFVTSLEFMAEPRQPLSEAGRVLRPGGLAVVLSLNPGTSWGKSRMKGREVPWDSAEKLRDLLEFIFKGGGYYRYALRITEGDVHIDAPPDEAEVLMAWVEQRK